MGAERSEGGSASPKQNNNPHASERTRTWPASQLPGAEAKRVDAARAAVPIGPSHFIGSLQAAWSCSAPGGPPG